MLLSIQSGVRLIEVYNNRNLPVTLIYLFIYLFIDSYNVQGREQ